MDVLSPAQSSIPTILITGYLGSGKTTLLNHFLKHPAFSDCVVIINEFGEIGLDHLLMATPAENTVLLENGCLCCEVRGDLVETLDRLHENAATGKIRRFNRVMIETSGLADPVPIIQTIISDTKLSKIFRLEHVVTVVDGPNGRTNLELHRESVKQVAVADHLILSKSDLVSPDIEADLALRLKEINPGARQTSSGKIKAGPEALFAGQPQPERQKPPAAALDWLGLAAYESGPARHGYARFRHDHGVRSFSFYYDEEIHPSGLVLWLNLLAAFKGKDLLRLKAILNVEGKPTVIQAVQTIIHEPLTLDDWPDAERRSRIVVIARNMKKADIESTLAAFSFRGSPKPGLPGIDPAAYSQFLDIARRVAAPSGND